MNFYLEQAAEEIDQAISDADQLQALIKATIQKLTNYLRRRQQEKLERRYLQNPTNEESQGLKPDKQTYNQIKILEYFNKLHKEADKQFRELKEMIPSNPQTYVMIEDPNEPEFPIRQQEVKQPQKSAVVENKLYPIFKSTQNGGLLKNLKPEVQKPEVPAKPEEPPKSKEKEAQFSYGRLQKFQYQKLKYQTKNEGNCVFCGLEANEQNLGPLLVVPSQKDSSSFTLHEMCGLWSQNLVFHNGSGYCDPDIDEEVEKSKKTKCFLCSRPGATLCCAICPQAFHFTCLMKSSSTGKLVEEEFKFFCDKHKYKIKDEHKTKDERKSKPKVKLNQSKARIKTSPKRSPRKSPKRGKSPSNQVIVRQFFIGNEDSKPSDGTMWQQVQQHIECKLEPQEQ